MRYILDNASDFLQDVGEDYVPDDKKPHFEEWNQQPDGGAFGSVDKDNEFDLVDAILDNLNPDLREVDSLIERVAAQAVPKADYPPRGIASESKKLWKNLMSNKSFLKHLRERTPQNQWALSHYIFTLHALKAGKKPFSYWTPAHAKAFATKHGKIQLNLAKKREFKKKSGETPEHYHQRTGRCPRHFVWKEDRKRCLHKEAA